MKQSVCVVALVASLLIFFGCAVAPPPIPPATVQTGQTGRCGNKHGVFVETGKMLVPRALHTATLLEDGTVLIAGGANGRPSQTLDSSEIFDPVRGIFLASGAMTTNRQQAVAVRLSDGRVLIAGGFAREGPTRFFTPLDSAEIFDPKNGTFSSTGPMGFGHEVHSATLLLEGNVLLIDDDSAKLFNPRAGTFTAATKPLITRYESAAVRLSDDKVLITCGGKYDETKKSAEIYDPKVDRFVRTGDMVHSAHACLPTLLPDGKVLLMGNSGDNLKYEPQIYDPRAGTFSSTDKLLLDLYEPVPSRLNDGRVLVTSDHFPGYPFRKDGLTFETYDPPSNAFKSLGAVQPDRSQYTSTTLSDGSVLIAGGTSDQGPLYPSTALLYCP